MSRSYRSSLARIAPCLAILGVVFNAFTPAVYSQTATGCAVATGDARELIARGLNSMGLARLDRPALGLRVIDQVSQDFQADRTYPPYVQEGRVARVWYYPDRQLETTLGEALDPFGARPLFATWSSARGTWFRRDSLWQPFPALHRFTAQTRPLNAWALMAEWNEDPAVRLTGRCLVRDFPRARVVRRGPVGEERLYLDPASGLPVQYEREEEDGTRLWSRRSVVYVYSNWVRVGSAQYPMATFRLVNGEIHISRTSAPLPADSAGPVPPMLSDTADMRLVVAPPATPPDTVRVGPNTVLLRTRSYTNLITLVRDTVFLLDAQFNGEERARQDSTWIARLFPGRHPVVLVVSDLAWPHIAGVRSWVAMGATVVGHRMTKGFLTRVVNHRWRGTPDLLERRRASTRFRFVAVEDSLSLGGGAVRVYAINGIGSEGALMTWLPQDQFLFAGDYVQGLRGPSMAYAAEVVAAARRVGVQPARFAAMHMGPTAWPDLEAALEPTTSAAAGTE